MGEHIDSRQLREQKAKRTKKTTNDYYDEAPKKKPRTFKQFVNEKTGTYEPEDAVDEDEMYRGIKIK